MWEACFLKQINNNDAHKANYSSCFQHLGSQDDIALKIKSDTHVKIAAMNKQVATNKDKVRCYGHLQVDGRTDWESDC